ncbi:hypothetical protein MI048_03735 [Pantoea agglomerans]|uniref:hypothetical protein n=1 Tax=Enterobacter agglomerans TaxID=549 RepID=UPI00311FE59A
MIINDSMYTNLSETFYEFDNSPSSDISKLRKKIKFIFETLVEQTHSHIFKTQFRNLKTTLRILNTSKNPVPADYTSLIETLQLSLSAPYPLSNKTYTDDNDDIINFVVNHMIPFVIELMALDHTNIDKKTALLNLLSTITKRWAI